MRYIIIIIRGIKMNKLFIIGIIIILAGTSFLNGCVETGATGTLHLKITDKPSNLDILYFLIFHLAVLLKKLFHVQ